MMNAVFFDLLVPPQVFAWSLLCFISSQEFYSVIYSSLFTTQW